MSKYTTQVRWLVEHYTPTMGGSPIIARVKASLPQIFDFDFPVYEPAHKAVLEEKIILHYFNKEIGLETVGLWKLYMAERLNLIMPYYNRLYEIEAKNFDMFDTSNNVVSERVNDNRTISDTTDRTLDGTDTGTDNHSIHTQNSGTDKTLTSDTPQANYNGLDYATELNKSEGQTTEDSTDNLAHNRTTHSTDKYTQTKRDGLVGTKEVTSTSKGGSKTYTEMMVDYRNAVINIDQMVVNELYDLFMLIY